MRTRLCVVGLFLAVSTLVAADGKLMHCFYFTPVQGATDADWEAFYKATAELPGRIPGLLKVWSGKLRSPMRQITTDGETRKKLAAGEKDVAATVNAATREYGVCMEFADEAALKTYAGHPAHKAWEGVYGKVRVPGTATMDILVR